MTTSLLKDIRLLTLPELKATFESAGVQGFRANQVYEWLWQKNVSSFEQMTNISKEFREYLTQNFEIQQLTIDKEQQSTDGTIKIRFKTTDNHLIEGVLIPSNDRLTACVSSQVGCSLSCKFCATGLLKRQRNLHPYEIFDQVYTLNQKALEQYQKKLTNIVYMGMGEPLLNYKNVLQSTEHIASEKYGLGMSPKRITVSTAGVSKMIRQLADDNTPFNLALSLHAPTDAKRNEIMPINETNTLQVLSEALRYYYQKLQRPVSYEYIVFKNFNDSIEDARHLASFCKIIPCKVNLIEYNAVEGLNWEKTDETRLQSFIQFIENKGITITLRRSRGKDIDAACGQLANKE